MVGKRSGRSRIKTGERKRARTKDNSTERQPNGSEESSAEINPTYLKETFQTSMKENLAIKKPLEDESGAKMSHEPFTHVVLPNFIADEKFVNALEKELQKLPFALKNNDLYTFHQSGDMSKVRGSFITPLKRMLESSFHQWLEEVTGIKFNAKVDMFCSQYQSKDVLLCHNDELEERRIAYILYLTPAHWQAQDGGALQLFTAQDNGDAKEIVKSILPQRNCLAFFEVSCLSWHQVQEVLSEDKTRLAVSGWFTGPPLRRPPRHSSPPPPLPHYSSIQEDHFYSWINPDYVEPACQKAINKKFADQSEIQLTAFLQEEKYQALVEALRGDVRWTQQGPPNKRCYLTCEQGDRPPIVQDFVQFMQSDAFFLVLSLMTGLRLHKEAPDSEEDDGETEEAASRPSTSQPSRSKSRKRSPGRQAAARPKKACSSRCLTEVRKWQHGNYTLCYDGMAQMGRAKFVLDAIFYIGCEDWDTVAGGFTSYTAKDDTEELLRVAPSSNCLALVYRERDLMRFVKYLNHACLDSGHPDFFDVSTVYFE